MGRVSIREGTSAAEPGFVALAPLPDADDEGALLAAFEAALRDAVAHGAESVAVAVAARGALPLQRRAEILLAAARAATRPGGSLAEVRFCVTGEPAYRLFESVQDAARIAEQMQRLGDTRT